YYGGVFGIAWGTGLRESTDGGAGWYSAVYDWSVSPSRITGGPAGWATYPLGNGSISAPVIGQVDGTYYPFAQGSRYLAASTNLTTWQKISDGLEYPGQSWRQAIQSMYDIQGWNDGLIAAVRKNFGEVEARLQI